MLGTFSPAHSLYGLFCTCRQPHQETRNSPGHENSNDEPVSPILESGSNRPALACGWCPPQLTTLAPTRIETSSGNLRRGWIGKKEGERSRPTLTQSVSLRHLTSSMANPLHDFAITPAVLPLSSRISQKPHDCEPAATCGRGKAETKRAATRRLLCLLRAAGLTGRARIRSDWALRMHACRPVNSNGSSACSAS
jgi:hypothetical protein